MIRSVILFAVAAACSFGDFWTARLPAAPLPSPRGVQFVTITRDKVKDYERGWTVLACPLASCHAATVFQDRLRPTACPPELHGIRVGIYIDGSVILLWAEPGVAKQQLDQLNEVIEQTRIQEASK